MRDAPLIGQRSLSPPGSVTELVKVSSWFCVEEVGPFIVRFCGGTLATVTTCDVVRPAAAPGSSSVAVTT